MKKSVDSSQIKIKSWKKAKVNFEPDCKSEILLKVKNQESR